MANNPTPCNIVQTSVWMTGGSFDRAVNSPHRTLIEKTYFELKSISRYRVTACNSLLIYVSGKVHGSLLSDCPVWRTDCDFVVAVFKMAVCQQIFKNEKLSFLPSVHKYENCIDPERHMVCYSRNIKLSVQYYLIWFWFIAKLLIGDHYIYVKKFDHHKRYTFVFEHKFRHFPDLPVLRDVLCKQSKRLPTAFKKFHWSENVFGTKLVIGGLASENFSTFRLSDAFH